MSEPPGVRRPGDESHLRLDPLQPRLHPPDQVLHPPIRPVLIPPECRVVQIRVGNLAAGFLPEVRPAMLAVADAAVVQAIEAEGVDVREFPQDLRQHLNEEVTVRPQQAQHAAVRKLDQVDLGDVGGVGRNPPPLRVSFPDLRLQARGVNSQDPHPQFLVLGDVLRESFRRHMRTSSLQKPAVVVRIEGVDEPHLADRHPMRSRCGPSFGLHH